MNDESPGHARMTLRLRLRRWISRLGAPEPTRLQALRVIEQCAVIHPRTAEPQTRPLNLLVYRDRKRKVA